LLGRGFSVFGDPHPLFRQVSPLASPSFCGFQKPPTPRDFLRFFHSPVQTVLSHPFRVFSLGRSGAFCAFRIHPQSPLIFSLFFVPPHFSSDSGCAVRLQVLPSRDVCPAASLTSCIPLRHQNFLQLGSEHFPTCLFTSSS